MSMNAVAALRIELARLTEALGEAEAPAGAKTPASATWVNSLYGGAILVHQLDDGVLVDLGHALGDVEPDELGAALRAHLGPLLDDHDDERGIFIFPDKARPSDKAIAAIVEEVGELGEWVQPPAAAGLPGMVGGGLEAMMGQMLGGMDPGQMQGLFEQAQQMMADPAMAEQMMAAAAQMMGGAGGGFDLSSLAEQAQRVVQDDPELAERLAKQLAASDDEDE